MRPASSPGAAETSREPVECPPPPRREGPPRLSLEEIELRGPRGEAVLTDLSLRVWPGEILGAAPLKITVGTLLSALICFPSLFVFSQSTESVLFMGLLHLLFWIVALWYGLAFLLRSTRRLGGQIWGGQLLVWCVIFLLVLLQMSTVLRPLVGESDRLLQPEKKFFLTHWAECLERACD